ncbi:hypothetical protein BFN03_00725 [Rhodococcus sp. WMMA185]|uniref:DUF6802 family protein n=1 Tax=Rhodococcus sp. WMMA185 TaxID=679318 RepID=UPI000878B0A6|nr:DUF6802 family protein [Rhodococcus sp. WMMA185]AOW91703.1 hypothetical protein BFN03_00725 [Rhodococcus sp. WMMA185]
MVAESFVVADVPNLDPDTFGHDAGAVVLTDPVYDIDGDGVFDTQTFTNGGAAVIASDMDADGDADHVTIVDEEGAYASWEFHRDRDGVVRWERTDGGILGNG